MRQKFQNRDKKKHINKLRNTFETKLIYRENRNYYRVTQMARVTNSAQHIYIVNNFIKRLAIIFMKKKINAFGKKEKRKKRQS